MIKTPFPVGRPVYGDEIIGRDKEIKELYQLLRDGQSLTLIAPRRYGKTTVLLEVLHKLKKSHYLTAEVDVFDAPGIRPLAEKIVASIIKNKYGPIDKILHKIKSSISEVLDNVELKALITNFELVVRLADKNTSEDKLLDQALDFPEIYAKKHKKHLILAFDEFNEIPNIGGDKLLKKMRSKMQRHRNVSYIFAGSQESIMKNIFMTNEGAFFRFGRFFNLGLIDKTAFGKYIKNEFLKLSLDINNENVGYILDKTDGHPYYTQLLCQSLYYLVKGGSGKITQNIIAESYAKALLAEHSRFEEIWQGLMNKKYYLLALKEVAHGRNPYKIPDVLPQQIGRILQSLEETGLLIKEKRGLYKLSDFLFTDYIRKYR